MDSGVVVQEDGTFSPIWVVLVQFLSQHLQEEGVASAVVAAFDQAVVEVSVWGDCCDHRHVRKGLFPSVSHLLALLLPSITLVAGLLETSLVDVDDEPLALDALDGLLSPNSSLKNVVLAVDVGLYELALPPFHLLPTQEGLDLDGAELLTVLSLQDQPQFLHIHVTVLLVCQSGDL